jgi:ActR/RegA family two-component response regulator
MTYVSDVLVVEDDALVARALWRRLTARGVRTSHVSHCAGAAALSGPFSAGIFDIDLPDGDGVELARQLLDRGVVGRAVFYTGCNNPERLWRARSFGAVLRKPANLASVVDTLSPGPGIADPAAELRADELTPRQAR